MFKMIKGTNANTALWMRVDRLQSRRQGPHHTGKVGIANLFDAVNMGDFDRRPVWPQRRRPEKIINRCHHLLFLPTDTAMVLVIIIIVGNSDTRSRFTLDKHYIEANERQSRQENTAEEIV